MYKIVTKETFKEDEKATKRITIGEFKTFGEAVDFLETNFRTQYIEEEVCWYIGDGFIPTRMVEIRYYSEDDFDGKPT